MPHFLLGLLITLIFVSGDAWSMCNPNDLKSTIDQGPCYKQINPLNIKTQKIIENEFVEYEVTPMKVTFENMSTPKLYQYMYVDINSDQSQSNVYMMSFVCDNETPIGGDALSDSLKQEGPERIFISTGSATDNLNANTRKKMKSKIYDRFFEIYEGIQGDQLFDTSKDNVYIPSLISSTSNQKEKKAYSSFFSTTNSSINGCSKKFLNTMNDYLLENIAKNRQFKDITLKKKKFSDKFLMKWML